MIGFAVFMRFLPLFKSDCGGDEDCPFQEEMGRYGANPVFGASVEPFYCPSTSSVQALSQLMRKSQVNGKFFADWRLRLKVTNL
jgi:hypothetical protein